MILDELAKNINLIIWLIFILLVIKKIKYGYIFDQFKRNVDIRIILLKKNNEIVDSGEEYKLLYEYKAEQYRIENDEPGMLINVKRNKIFEVFVLNKNKKVGSQRINSGVSELEFIDITEDKNEEQPKEN